MCWSHSIASRFQAKPCVVCYPHMLQVAVPFIFYRWRYKPYRTILHHCYMNKPYVATYRIWKELQLGACEHVKQHASYRRVVPMASSKIFYKDISIIFYYIIKIFYYKDIYKDIYFQIKWDQQNKKYIDLVHLSKLINHIKQVDIVVKDQ